MSRPVMYQFLNKGLGMSTGKAAAQASHAACLVVEDAWGAKESGIISEYKWDLYREWMDSGHYTKLVMQAEDSMQIFNIRHYLDERGYQTYLVIDEGRTENTAFKPTALAAEIVDKDDPRTAGIFGEFKLFRDTPTKDPKKGFFR